MMQSVVTTMPFIVKVEQAFKDLECTNYNGFPVLNNAGRPIGIIERDVLIAMIEEKAWYQRPSRESGKFGSKIESAHQESINEENSQKRLGEE